VNAGEAVIPSRFLWQDFRARYEAEVVPGLAPRTGEKISSVFDRFEADINPRRLWDVDEKRLSAFVSNLRKWYLLILHRMLLQIVSILYILNY
jgi:hypothetical protein